MGSGWPGAWRSPMSWSGSTWDPRSTWGNRGTWQAWVDSTLADLDVRRKYGASVLAIRRGGQIRAMLQGGEALKSGDRLIIVGHPDTIARIVALS